MRCDSGDTTPSASTSNDNSGSQLAVNSNKTAVPGVQQCTKTNGFDLNSEKCLCGTKICDEASGLVCDIQSEVCSSPCSNGENCCSVFFEPKDSTGCDVANDRYCIAASKGKVSEFLLYITTSKTLTSLIFHFFFRF